MGFYWTNNGHKRKQACEPFLTNEEETQKARETGTPLYLHFAFTLWFNPEIFTENTIIKRSCFSYILEFIHVIHMTSSK